MIRVENVWKRLGGQDILRGVDLRIGHGEILALVGPSGTGKSVLLKHVIGLMTPDAGEIIIDGQRIGPSATYAELTALRRRMGYVFQDAALLDSLTIGENLRLALDDDACARDPAHCPRRVLEALTTVNLDESVLDKRPGEVSGGMRKRVGVARAIIDGPDIILYDEPTTGLDPRNVASITDVVLRARDRLGATSVVVTHDLASVDRVADRVALLDAGRIAFVGPPQAFFGSDDPAVRSFIGRDAPTRAEVA